MAGFDDFVGATKECFNKVAAKTSDAMEISKNQMERVRLKSEISESFRQLGEVYYNMVAGNDSEERVKVLLREIDKLYGDLKLLEDTISAKGGPKFCPSCTYKNIAEAEFCIKCGTKLS